MSIPSDRAAVRTILLARRAAIGAYAQAVAAGQLKEHISRWLGDALPARASGYIATRDEIDVMPTLEWLRQSGCETFVPVMRTIDDERLLLFARHDNETILKPGKYGIPVPDIPDKELIGARDLDLVMVPLVGFDRHGNRLGMGGGYYDRTFNYRLESKPANQRFLGVAHDLQQLESIDAEPWDIPLDAVATDLTCYDSLRISTSD